MGLMPGSRAAHKVGNGIASGFSRRWVCGLCIASFCFGVVVVNRFWSVPDIVDLDKNATGIGKSGSGGIHSAINCETKLDASETGDISKTHEIIITLDKTISSLEMQLSAARAAKAEIEKKPKGAMPGNESSDNSPKVFFVMGIITAFSSRKRRDSIRETWMPQGEGLKKLYKERGIVIRFVIGHRVSNVCFVHWLVQHLVEFWIGLSMLKKHSTRISCG